MRTSSASIIAAIAVLAVSLPAAAQSSGGASGSSGSAGSSSSSGTAAGTSGSATAPSTSPAGTLPRFQSPGSATDPNDPALRRPPIADPPAPNAATPPRPSTGTSSTTPSVDQPASGSNSSIRAERDDRVGSTMEECMSTWDESSHMTKGEWRRSCTSLLADPTRD